MQNNTNQQKKKSYFYPDDIDSSIVNSGKLTGASKHQFVVSMVLIGNVFLFGILYFFFRAVLKMPFFIVLLLYLVIGAVASAITINVFVFKEDQRRAEYKASGSYSFAKYYRIRKDTEHPVDIGFKQKVKMYEYITGQRFLCLALRYGSTDEVRQIGTKNTLAELIRVLVKCGFCFHTLDINEEYDTTDECRWLIDDVNNITDPTLKKTMLDIVEFNLELSRRRSKVKTTYFIIHTSSAVSNIDISSDLRQIVSVFGKYKSSLRKVEFLEFDAFKYIIEKYNGLETLDLSLMKATTEVDDELEELLDSIKLYSVESEDGSVYSDKNIVEDKMQVPVEVITR